MDDEGTEPPDILRVKMKKAFGRNPYFTAWAMRFRQGIGYQKRRVCQCMKMLEYAPFRRGFAK